jgi:hypothetical protein
MNHLVLTQAVYFTTILGCLIATFVLLTTRAVWVRTRSEEAYATHVKAVLAWALIFSSTGLLVYLLKG